MTETMRSMADLYKFADDEKLVQFGATGKGLALVTTKRTYLIQNDYTLKEIEDNEVTKGWRNEGKSMPD